MGSELTTAGNLPKDAATGLILPLSKSLGLQDLAKHKAMVALELEVLAKKYDRFGWDRDRDTASQDRLIMDWIAALQDFPLPEIQAACRAHVEADPKNMPNEGHIKALILGNRERAVKAYKASLPPPPERELPPVDARVAIAASLGLPVLKRMPKGGPDAA